MEIRVSPGSPLVRGLGIVAALLIAAGAIAPAFAAAELVGPIHMNVADAEQTIGTFGPFTLSSRCFLFMGDVEAAVLIRTSEASTLQAPEYYSVFEPGGTYTFSDEVQGNPPGGPTVGLTAPFASHGAHAIAPSGTSIMG